MKLYISDLSLIVLAIVYLPLVIWMLWWAVRSKKLAGVKKVFTVLVALVLAYVIPLGDVTLNSIAMEQACSNVGVHIYSTAKVDGYFIKHGSEDFFRHRPGFRFVEYKRPGEIIRLEKRDGQIVKTILPSTTAEYEVLNGQWEVDKGKGIRVLRDVVRNRVTGSVLAERLMFNPLPGWVDRFTIIRWFGEFMPGCHGSDPGAAFQNNVLFPKESN